MDYSVLIALVTPIVIWGVKALIPSVPKVALPVAAPLVGAAGDVALYLLGLKTTADPAMGAIYGASGVAIREIVDQIKKAVVA